MKRKTPQVKRGSSKKINKKELEFLDEKAFSEMLKSLQLEKKKRDNDGYSIEIAYPIQYTKNVDDDVISVIITTADGIDHWFYYEDGEWDYDGSGSEYDEKGKRAKSKNIVGYVKVYLPVKSLKVGAKGVGLTIIDAKNKTYKFS